MRAILFVAASMLAASLHAAPKASAEGQSQAEHVSFTTGVIIDGSSCPKGYLQAFRQLPDGSQGGFGEFIVPEGKWLVLKDFGFGLIEKAGPNYFYEYPWSAKSLITVDVYAGLPDPQRKGASIYQTSIPIDSDMQEIGRAWIDRSLASGIVIAPGHRLCIGADLGWGRRERVSMATLTRLYGYLIDQ